LPPYGKWPKKTVVWGARYQKIPGEPITVQRQINNRIFS
jgi:hypothetical protein